MLIRKAKIENLTTFLKEGDESHVAFPVNKSPPKKVSSLSMSRDPLSPTRNLRHGKSNGNDGTKIRIKNTEGSRCNFKTSRQSFKVGEDQPPSPLRLNKIESDYKQLDSEESDMGDISPEMQSNFSNFSEQDEKKKEAVKVSNALNSQLLQINFNNNYQRLIGKQS